jgi:hypothetical protein
MTKCKRQLGLPLAGFIVEPVSLMHFTLKVYAASLFRKHICQSAMADGVFLSA